MSSGLSGPAVRSVNVPLWGFTNPTAVTASTFLCHRGVEATEQEAQFRVPRAGTLRRLSCRATAGVNTTGHVTVNVNGVASALTASLAGGGAGQTAGFGDTVNEVAVVQNDLVSFESARDVGTGTWLPFTGGLEFEPTP